MGDFSMNLYRISMGWIDYMGSWPKAQMSIAFCVVYIPKQAVIWPIILLDGPNVLSGRPTLE
jgi:hypothetical protein